MDQIAHYVNEVELWTTYYLPAQEANPDVVYNYVHDPETENEISLIKVVPPTSGGDTQTDYFIPMEKRLHCRLCKGTLWKTYSGSVEGLVRHVRDV